MLSLIPVSPVPAGRAFETASWVWRAASTQRRMANQGLQDLYDWLGGESWKCHDGWLDPGSDVREWYGLTITTAGDLVSINLISNDLEVGGWVTWCASAPPGGIFRFCGIFILRPIEKRSRVSSDLNFRLHWTA